MKETGSDVAVWVIALLEVAVDAVGDLAIGQLVSLGDYVLQPFGYRIDPPECPSGERGWVGGNPQWLSAISTSFKSKLYDKDDSGGGYVTVVGRVGAPRGRLEMEAWGWR